MHYITEKTRDNMKDYQIKLTEKDLKKIEENNGDLYCLFSEAQLFGYGIYGAKVITINNEKYLCYSMGNSCD